MRIYTVKRGDSLYSIARRFGADSDLIAMDNGLHDQNRLSVGDSLVIRSPVRIHIASEGENIYSVAGKYMTTVNKLWRSNQFLKGELSLSVGDKIIVEDEAPEYSDEISVNAYAYPSIDREVLRKTLPYLTYLTVFSYGIEADGDLLDIDDEAIIELSRQYGVAPIMLVSSIGDEGIFSEELAISILSNEKYQKELIENIVNTMTQKRYSGVCVDFEFIPKEYADKYADFLDRLNQQLDQCGAIVMTALAPKISDEQAGILYEGHNYKALGEASDKAFLMTYEWGDAYASPMPTAPIDKMREVAEYAVGCIQSQKLFLGIPNYGYDRKIPYVAEKSIAKLVGNAQANDIAREKQSAISLDECSMSAMYSYFEKENGRNCEHIVWFENSEGLKKKLDLVHMYGLGGISIWNAMRYCPNIWLILNGMYNIRKIFK